MIAWTTPTKAIRVKGGAILGSNVKVLFTFAQNGHRLTLEPISMEAQETGVLCEVRFTQIQSGGFKPGVASVQVNVIDSNGFRAASRFKEIYLDPNLFPWEVKYE